MTRIRFTREEKQQRAAAQRTLADPNASVSATYHARLLLKQTESDAIERAEKNEQRLDAPVIVHRSEMPVDPNLRRFMDSLSAMLENQSETVTAETSQPADQGTPVANVGPRAPMPEPPTSNEICTLCLIPRENCGHGSNQSQMR
jgi:hypothetical protein